MGIVVDANKPDYVQGDFLVRGLVGADPATGKVAVAADVHPGQVVRLHARDADSADRDLREALEVRMAALGGRAPAGALVFACNGRGRGHVRRAPTTTPTRSPRRCSARRPPGSSPPARSARSAASTSCTASRRPSPCSRRLARLMELRGRTALVTGATGGLGHAIARALAARGADADPDRPPGGRARAAGRRDRRRARSRATSPTPPTSTGCSTRRATSTCSSPTPACRAAGTSRASRSRRSTARSPSTCARRW